MVMAACCCKCEGRWGRGVVHALCASPFSSAHGNLAVHASYEACTAEDAQQRMHSADSMHTLSMLGALSQWSACIIVAVHRWRAAAGSSWSWAIAPCAYGGRSRGDAHTGPQGSAVARTASTASSGMSPQVTGICCVDSCSTLSMFQWWQMCHTTTTSAGSLTCR